MLVVFIIAESNLAMLRADGFYKFCFSYDTSAEEFNKRGEKEAAYQTRLACARYFQNALRYAPGERAYLNGSGRNFLELSKMIGERIRSGIIKEPPKNKLKELPTIKELIEIDWHRIRDFSPRDFLVCSASCIQKAYELDPKNFERIIAMIRIYRYWGDLDRDISKYEKGLVLCDEARKASPLNEKTDEEKRELDIRISSLRPPPSR
jgi:tetratricopeptide (TPR) repeat protein